MIVPFLVFTPMLKAEIDHQQALVIWQRARLAHGIEDHMDMPSIGWHFGTGDSKPGADDLARDIAWNYLSITTMIVIQGADCYIINDDYADATASKHSADQQTNLASNELSEIRAQFLRHPYGIFNSPKQSVTLANGKDRFSVNVKGVRTTVTLESETGLIKQIEFRESNGTNLTRKFSYGEKIAVYDGFAKKERKIFVPNAWNDYSNNRLIGGQEKVIHSFNFSCWGRFPWIPEGYSIDP